jgi:hypothetical protein
MAAPVVFQIVSDGMARQKTAHKLRNPLGTTEYQEMEVITEKNKYSGAIAFAQMTLVRSEEYFTETLLVFWVGGLGKL